MKDFLIGAAIAVAVGVIGVLIGLAIAGERARLEGDDDE